MELLWLTMPVRHERLQVAVLAPDQHLLVPYAGRMGRMTRDGSTWRVGTDA